MWLAKSWMRVRVKVEIFVLAVNIVQWDMSGGLNFLDVTFDMLVLFLILQLLLILLTTTMPRPLS